MRGAVAVDNMRRDEYVCRDGHPHQRRGEVPRVEVAINKQTNFHLRMML